MRSETDDEIEAVARAMMACTLPKAASTHCAYFAAALWLLRARRSGLAGRNAEDDPAE